MKKLLRIAAALSDSLSNAAGQKSSAARLLLILLIGSPELALSKMPLVLALVFDHIDVEPESAEVMFRN